MEDVLGEDGDDCRELATPKAEDHYCYLSDLGDEWDADLEGSLLLTDKAGSGFS